VIGVGLGSTVVNMHNYSIGVIAMSMGGEGLKMWWTGPVFQGDDAAIHQAEVDWVTSVFGTLDAFHKTSHRIHGDAHRENFVKCNGDTDKEKLLIVDLGRSKRLQELPIEQTMVDSIKLIDLLHLLKGFYTSPRDEYGTHSMASAVLMKWTKLHKAIHVQFASLFENYMKNVKDVPELLMEQCFDLFSPLPDLSGGDIDYRPLPDMSGGDIDYVQQGGDQHAYQSKQFSISDLLYSQRSPISSSSVKETDSKGEYNRELDMRKNMLERIIQSKWFKISRKGTNDIRIKENDKCTFLDIVYN